MSMRHFTIPIFIPMEACPFRCIYCDQEKISGHAQVPDAAEIKESIEKHLATMPKSAEIEVGFFGGTFTGLPQEKQVALLETVQPFIQRGQVKSIRLSTRPDFIDDKILQVLKAHHVGTIELGAQSMDDEVLRQSGRGHKAVVTVAAAKMIKASGFRLGLQMMIGLPGDSAEKNRATAEAFVAMGAEDVRIYPCLIIKGTPLEKRYLDGKYQPLSLAEAVQITAQLFPIFEDAGIRIIRTGLHPSEGFLNGDELVAGPFHVSFKELVVTQLWNEILKQITVNKNAEEITVSVAPGQTNAAIGYGAVNKKMLAANYKKVRFRQDASLQKREFYVDYR